jgi:hypothetical protein
MRWCVRGRTAGSHTSTGRAARSDFWQLAFHYDRDDRSCEHLFLPTERLLAWWTEHRVAVRHAFAAMA